MSDQTRQQLQQALELIKSGQRDQARVLLQSVISADPNNADAWWMMATAVSSPIEMKIALEKVVRIRPDYPNAQQMLNQINAQVGVPATAQPAPEPPRKPETPTQISVVAAPPTKSQPASGSQMGESLDDLFAAPLSSSSSSSTSASPSSIGPAVGPSDSGPVRPATPIYTPPPPNPAKKQRNPLLYVLIGLVIAVVCLCGGCLLLTGGGFLAVANNPTFQAAVGTGIAMIDVPLTPPPGAANKGAISANQSQSSTLEPLQQDVWQYEGRANEKITITVNVTSSSSSFTPYIGVYQADGTRIGKTQLGASSGKTQTLSVTLPDAGTYTILVGGLASKQAGYTVKVQSSSSQ